MHSIHIARRANRDPHNRDWAGLVAALLSLLCVAWSAMEAQQRQRSAFPPACLHLSAQMRSTPNGPEDELRFDTQRVQDALNLCPAGQAVELEAVELDAQRLGAFLVAPLRVPAGVTLLIDAGVTVYASRRTEDYRNPHAVSSQDLPCGNLPCRALIETAGAAGSFPSSISGFGTLDGRASLPLFDRGSGIRTWANLPAGQRPDLILANGNFELHQVTIRDAPGTALHLTGTAFLERAKFVESTSNTDASSILVTSPEVRVAIRDSTFSQSFAAINAAMPARLSLDRIGIHNGTVFSNAWLAGAPSRCIARTKPTPTCTPAELPLYLGDVFLSDSLATNLVTSGPGSDLFIHAVVSETEAGLPSASGPITFYDGSTALGTASLVDGTATLKLPALDPARGHILTARDVSGSVSFGSGQALVQPNLTSLALSANATHTTFNMPVDLTASSTPATATGLVSFYDGAALLGQTALSAGTASFTATQLTAGTHTLTSHYAGDSNNNSADSPALNLRIDQAQASLRFSAPPATALYGTLNSATVNVFPSSASGSITLTDRFTANGQTTLLSLGRAFLSGGTASLPLLNPAVGSHALTATYSGDANYLSTVTAPTTLAVSALPTSLSLSIPQTTLAYGSAAGFVATVLPSSATGSINFRDSVAGVLGQIPITNGAATLTMTTLSPGTHSVSAAYAGDAIDAASTSPSLNVTITRAPSIVVLMPLPAMLSAGSSLTLTASIQPGSASGFVTFSTTSGGNLGQAQIVGGVATLKLNSLAPGNYFMLATYSGDSFITPSTSPAQPTQITGDSSITLATSITSAIYGSPITLSAAITPAFAAGSVTFSDATLGTLGTVTVSNGSAAFSISHLAPGSHTLLAIYSGDSTHSPASSSPMSLTVTQAVTRTSLTLARTSVAAGSSIAVNVQVATQPGVLPTGTVEVLAGGRVLATAQITSGLPGAGFVTLSVPSSTLGLGSFAVAAVYNGDRNNTASSSSLNPVIKILATPTTSALVLSSSQIWLSAPVALTVRVAASAAAGAPTGSVSFLDNGVSFTSAPVNANGSAAATFVPSKLGSHALSAIYQPTAFFAGSSAANQPLTVTQPIFLKLAPQALTATANSTHTVTLTLTPLSGFTGLTRSSCTSPASFITCTVLAPDGLRSTVQITIAPDLAGQAALERSLPLSNTFTLACLFPICLLFPRRSLRAHPHRGAAQILGLLLMSLLLTTSLIGCALGGNFFTIPTGPQTISVAASAGGAIVASTLTINITR